MKKAFLLVLLLVILMGSIIADAEECQHENTQRLMWNSEAKAFLPYCWDCHSSLPEFQVENNEEGVIFLKIFLLALIIIVAFVISACIISARGSGYMQYMGLDTDDDD